MAGMNVRYREWLKTGERMLARTASRSGWHRYCCLVGGTGGGGGVGWNRTGGVSSPLLGRLSRPQGPHPYLQPDFPRLPHHLQPLQTKMANPGHSLPKSLPTGAWPSARQVEAGWRRQLTENPISLGDGGSTHSWRAVSPPSPPPQQTYLEEGSRQGPQAEPSHSQGCLRPSELHQTTAPHSPLPCHS